MWCSNLWAPLEWIISEDAGKEIIYESRQYKDHSDVYEPNANCTDNCETQLETVRFTSVSLFPHFQYLEDDCKCITGSYCTYNILLGTGAIERHFSKLELETYFQQCGRLQLLIANSHMELNDRSICLQNLVLIDEHYSPNSCMELNDRSISRQNLILHRPT